MRHAKVKLADAIDWEFLIDEFGGHYDTGELGSHPALSTRLMAGLYILKYTDNLSDEKVCAKFVENL